MQRKIKLKGLDVEFAVEYVYHPGEAPTPPSYSSGGEPGEPPMAEIDFVSIGGVDVTQMLTDYAGVLFAKLEAACVRAEESER